MKVTALVSFVGFSGGVKVRANEGDVIDMPEGADWLSAGLVEPFEEQKSVRKAPESAAVEPSESAMKPPAKKRKSRKKA